MKKISLLIMLLASVGVYGCGGGGAGSADVPAGENPGVPTIVQLNPVHFIAQTNSTIFLRAKVLDGNGVPVANVPVIFTNLSPTGTLRAASLKPAALSPTTAVTDALGIATATLFSTTSDFATVQAEINTGTGIVRDKKTVFFSNFDIAFPSPVEPPTPPPTLTLDVDGDNDGNFNESSDFNLFENTNDNQVIIRATVETRSGTAASGVTVDFGADSTEATFPDGDLRTTDANGQAQVRVLVVPEDIRNLQTVLNITASATVDGDSAFNLVTLFLAPVTVDTVTVFANPRSVDSGGTSDISAQVTTTAGTPVPDGTTVNFTATQGGVEPFAQTTNGIATAQFTAPTIAAGGLNQNATITASVGGKSGSTSVTVLAPPEEPVEPPTPPALTVSPSTASVSCDSGGVRTFVVTGGTPGYSITSSNPAVTLDTNTISTSGGSFTATITADCGPFTAASSTVPIIVTDSVGAVASTTITVINPNP